MSSDHAAWREIDRRVAAAFGPGWDTGGVWDLDENSLISPKHSAESKSWFTMMWPTVEDVEVADGGGSVVAVGQIRGWDVSHGGRLDDVLASLGLELAQEREQKRSFFGRLFGN